MRAWSSFRLDVAQRLAQSGATAFGYDCEHQPRPWIELHSDIARVRRKLAAQVVASLPIEKFHGVGPATAARRHAHGIFSGADLAAMSMEQMTEKFGRSAQYYFDLARGIDEREVQPHGERKSLGAEDTFAADISTTPSRLSALGCT